METFMGILSGITMLLPIGVDLFKKIAAAKKKDTAETAANVVVTKLKTLADTEGAVATGAQTAATWLLNAALAVKKVLENPITGAIVVGAALAAAAAISIYANNVKKANEEKKELNK
jgi:TRAP-type C4-dicarboxylate transport system permease small subunit